MSQKNLNINFNEKLIKSESIDQEEIDAEVINLYSKLNEKCDDIIGKVRVRKAKKKNII